MTWLIVVVQIVDRLDEPDAKDQSPEPIGDGPGEKWIRRTCQPLGEGDARTLLVLPFGFTVVKEGDWHRLAGVWNHQLAATGHFPDAAACAGSLDAGEEGGHAPELVAAPLGKRMIVAL